MTGIIRAFEALIDDINMDDRSLVAKINTDEIDRYNSVIDPKGGRFENYRRNPITLWEHGKDPRRGTDPIGQNLWLKPNGQKILAKTRFLKDDFSQQRYEWYRDGVLNGFSVNILPDGEHCSPPTKDEIRARPELHRCSQMYRSWDLAEYSGTAVPGNASCLQEGRSARLLQCVERGLWLPDEVIAQLRTMTDSQGGMQDGGAVAENSAKCIKKRGAKYIVCDADGAEMSEHDDIDSAEACLKMPAKRSLEMSLECDGQTWTLYDCDRNVLFSHEDARVVERAQLALTQSRTWTATHAELYAEQAQRSAELLANIQAELDLKLRGIV